MQNLFICNIRCAATWPPPVSRESEVRRTSSNFAEIPNQARQHHQHALRGASGNPLQLCGVRSRDGPEPARSRALKNAIVSREARGVHVSLDRRPITSATETVLPGVTAATKVESRPDAIACVTRRGRSGRAAQSALDQEIFFTRCGDFLLLPTSRSRREKFVELMLDMTPNCALLPRRSPGQGTCRRQAQAARSVGGKRSGASGAFHQHATVSLNETRHRIGKHRPSRVSRTGSEP